ncbi:hypothetical protein EU545_01910 [Candidatus Thorarchaeota archaeon]|nr:MAG: hypothetical protein EU545_01910 [Candidatus Thorarchaeota archaeon]
MGIALDSLLMVLQYSGLTSIIAAALVGYWRLRTERTERNLIQRFPLLLPAIVFLVTSGLVLSLLPVPISEYRGVNSRSLDYSEDYNVTFSMYESGAIYQDTVNMIVTEDMSPGDYITVECEVYWNEALNRTETIELNGTQSPGLVQESRSLDLAPGTYRFVINGTLYNTDNTLLQVEIVQRLRSGIVDELRDWSNYQLTLNLIVTLFVIGGLCINQRSVYKPKYGRPLYPESDEATS